MESLINAWQQMPAQINPAIFSIGSFQLRYYSLMYIVAFAIVYFLVLYRIKHEKYKNDQLPIDEQCNCYTCKHYSRAYLRHLFMSKEYNSAILNSIHNLYYYLNLMKTIREHIQNNSFSIFAKEFIGVTHASIEAPRDKSK